MNRVWPGLLVTVTVPSCAVVTACTMARPRPVLVAPVAVCVRALSPRTNRSNSVGCRSGGMPGPSSVTSSVTVPAPSALAVVSAGGDGGAGRGVLGRVAQQVGQHLVQPVLIAGHHDRLIGQFQQPPVAGGGGPGVAGRVDGQPGQIDRLAGQRPPGVQLGQQQQLVDQHAHPRRLRLHPAQCVPDVVGYRARVAQRQLGVAADGGQRGAQLVAGVGGEPAQPCLAGRPAGQRARHVPEHPVECQRRPARPRCAGWCRAPGQTASTSPDGQRQLGDPGRGRRHPPQRAQRPAAPAPCPAARSAPARPRTRPARPFPPGAASIASRTAAAR